MDEIEINEDFLTKLKSMDIILCYTSHPDLTLNLVEELHHKVGWIIIGFWRGDGFKNQLESYGNVKCPVNMCDLEENGNSTYDEFTSQFGKPIVEIEITVMKLQISGLSEQPLAVPLISLPVN